MSSPHDLKIPTSASDHDATSPVVEEPELVRPLGCTRAGITDATWLGLAHGTASPEERNHVAECADCRIERSRWVNTEYMLRAALIRPGCPPVDELLGFQAGLLSVWDQHALRQHLDGCTDCQAEVRALDIESAQTHPAAALWERVRAVGSSFLSAMLQPAPPALHAVRGGEQQELHFRASACEIFLAVRGPHAPETRGRIEGQLLLEQASAEPGERFVVGLFEGSVPVGHDYVDEFGYFALEDVHSGEYTLWVGLSRDVVRVEHIMVP